MVKEIVRVSFGGATAIYINDKLEKFKRGQFHHIDIVSYLFEIIHYDFKPLQTICISEYSTYWDRINNYSDTFWMPDTDLSDLKSKLDTEFDIIYS